MLQNLKTKFDEWRLKRNTLMIVVDIRKGKIVVSHKDKVATGGFTDNTLRNMMNGVRFEKNVQNFLIAQAKLINQIVHGKKI